MDDYDKFTEMVADHHRDIETITSQEWSDLLDSYSSTRGTASQTTSSTLGADFIPFSSEKPRGRNPMTLRQMNNKNSKDNSTQTVIPVADISLVIGHMDQIYSINTNKAGGTLSYRSEVAALLNATDKIIDLKLQADTRELAWSLSTGSTRMNTMSSWKPMLYTFYIIRSWIPPESLFLGFTLENHKELANLIR
jgi:hypothetical protein